MVRQRVNVDKGKTQMDWDMFKDVPYLLMTAGEYNSIDQSPITTVARCDEFTYQIYHFQALPMRISRILPHVLGHLFQLLLHRSIRPIPPPPRQPRISQPPHPHERNQPPRPPAPPPPLRSPPRPRQHNYPVNLPHRRLPLHLDQRYEPHRHYRRRLLLRVLLRCRAGAV